MGFIIIIFSNNQEISFFRLIILKSILLLILHLLKHCGAFLVLLAFHLLVGLSHLLFHTFLKCSLSSFHYDLLQLKISYFFGNKLFEQLNASQKPCNEKEFSNHTYLLLLLKMQHQN